MKNKRFLNNKPFLFNSLQPLKLGVKCSYTTRGQVVRLVKVHTPKGRGKDVIRVAFSAGIERVSLENAECHYPDGHIEQRDVIDIETSTPQAKTFVDDVLNADFFDRKD